MALTVVQTLQILYRRWGECAPLADFQDALYRSAVLLGLTPAAVGAVTDLDISGVTGAQYPQLVDVAEERGLQTICTNLDPVTLTNLGIKTDVETLRKKYFALADKKAKFIEKAYMIGLAQLTVGVVDLNFQEQADESTIDYF